MDPALLNINANALYLDLEEASITTNIKDVLELGRTQENAVPISEIFASGTPQTHYNAPLSWDNNIHPKTTSENLNMQVVLSPPTVSSTSGIISPTVTTAAYPQPESYTVQHNFEGATSDLCAQHLTPAGDTRMAGYDLSLFAVPYLEHHLGDPPVSSAGRTQVAPAGTIGFGLAQGSMFPKLESETGQYNMKNTTRHCNTLPGWFDDELFINFEALGSTLSEDFRLLENESRI